jgi:hypothetical protein
VHPSGSIPISGVESLGKAAMPKRRCLPDLGKRHYSLKSILLNNFLQDSDPLRVRVIKRAKRRVSKGGGGGGGGGGADDSLMSEKKSVFTAMDGLDMKDNLDLESGARFALYKGSISFHEAVPRRLGRNNIL